jgi:hypothetical protein
MTGFRDEPSNEPFMGGRSKGILEKPGDRLLRIQIVLLSHTLISFLTHMIASIPSKLSYLN